MEGEHITRGEKQAAARQAHRSRRAHPAVVALGAVLVIVLAVGALYAYRTFLARPALGIERLLPASTMAYFSFNASPDGRQGEAAARIRQAFEAQPGFREAWDRITRPLLDALGLGGQDRPDNPADLSQYLGGNVTVALLPLGSEDLQKLRDAELGAGEPEAEVFDVLARNVVALVDLDFDALGKRGLLSDLKRRAEQPGQAAVAERHRDVDIRRFDTGASAVDFALVDGSSTAIVGAHVEPVRAVIDTYLDNRGLSGSIHSGLVREVPSERVAALYVNLSEIYRALRLADPEGTNSGAVRDLRGAVLAALGAYDGGLRVDVATEADMTLLPSPDIDADGPGGIAVNPDARPDVSTLADVPLDAHAFLVGADLRTPLEQLLQVARQNEGSDIARRLRQFEAEAGLDLATEVAPLLSGDYVLSARLEDAGDGALSPSVVFELKVRDEARARAVLERLAANATDLRRETIAGGEFYVAGGGLAFGTVSRRAWVAWEGDGEGVTDSLARAIEGIGKGLTATEQWREAAKPLPRYSNVIAHVDARAVRQAAEASPGIVRDRDAYKRDVAPLLRPLRYVLLGSASYSPERALLSRNHMVIFLGIGE